MARNIPTSALTALAKKRGVESVLVIGVQWGIDSNYTLYSDKPINQTGIPSVKVNNLEIGVLDSILAISQNEQSQEASVTLSDVDGSLKEILDTHDIHQRNVKIWQWFEGIPFEDRFLILMGKINSPIVWSEGDRTLTFSVLTQLEDREIGFSIEEGDFDDEKLDDLIGDIWPECFGLTINEKALQIDRRYQGSLADPIGIADFAIPNAVTANNTIAAFCEEWAVFWYIQAGMLKFIGDESGYETAKANGDGFMQSAAQYRQQAEDLGITLREQQATERSAVRIIGGEKFPRGGLFLNIGGGLFFGFFGNVPNVDADRFYVKVNYHPEIVNYAELHTPDIIRIFLGSPEIESKILPYPVGFSVKYNSGNRGFIVYTGEIGGETAGPFFAQAGASVSIASFEPHRYVVSITPGIGGPYDTGVLKVASFTTYENGQRVLVDIPTDKWTSFKRRFGAITATFVQVQDAPSKYDQGWEDQIYVTFLSKIGPNTADIMEYLIGRYTDLGIDLVSFDQVREKVKNYPMDFCFHERKNIFTALQELAYMARCAIFLRNGIFVIRYLPEEPKSIFTFNESNVDTNSIELKFTESENLITKFIGTWRPNGAVEDDSRVILRYNVRKYGLHTEEFDFYAYNFIDAVIKSMTFWIIRRGNTWKLLSFSASLDALNTEVFDGATLDFVENYASNAPVLGQVEQSDYDSDANRIDFTVWTSIRAGEMEPFDFAFPHAISQTLKFPTSIEESNKFTGGGGIGQKAKGILRRRGPFSSTRQSENPYQIQTAFGENRTFSDKGGQKPSDAGDIHPGNTLITFTGAATLGAGPPPTQKIDSYMFKEKEPTVIDIRKTRVIDSKFETSATFDTWFKKIDANKQLVAKHDALFDDDEDDATQYRIQCEAFEESDGSPGTPC